MFPKLRRVTLTSGESIEISNGVTAIVGPNNAGKSLLLAEVNRWFSLPQGFQLSPPNRVLRELSVSESAPMTELLEWLGTRYPHRGPGTYPQGEILQPHLVLPNNNYIPGGLFTVGRLTFIRRVEMNGGPFIERIGLPHTNSQKTSRLTCILPLGFLGIASWISVR